MDKYSNQGRGPSDISPWQPKGIHHCVCMYIMPGTILWGNGLRRTESPLAGYSYIHLGHVVVLSRWSIMASNFMTGASDCVLLGLWSVICLGTVDELRVTCPSGYARVSTGRQMLWNQLNTLTNTWLIIHPSMGCRWSIWSTVIILIRLRCIQFRLMAGHDDDD